MPYNSLDRYRRSTSPRSAPISIIWLVSRPFVWLYRLGDLIFDFKKRGAASNLERLSREVESECSDLFSKYQGRIIPELSSGYPAFDFATVVAEVRSLQLRAIRDRGLTSWEISGSGSGSLWQPLEPLCRKYASKPDGQSSAISLLTKHFSEIEQSLSKQ